MLDYNTGLARFAGQGAWNDPDMLEGERRRGLPTEADARVWGADAHPARGAIDRPPAAAPLPAVGVGRLTLPEQRSHFALWALMKAPLLIGADLRSIHPDSLAVLKAKEVIAVNQDPLGVAGDLVWMQGASRVSGGGGDHL